MAETAVVGILRALLTLDSATYETGLKRITKDTKVAETTFGDLGAVVKSLGGILAGAFTAQAIIGYGKQVLEFADNIGDLSDQTGISTDRLQALNYVMAGSGVTVENLAQGVAQLSKNLVGGDKGAAAAIKALGLEIDEVLAMDPDEAFIAIGEAVSKIPDPMERAAIMMELFGRSGAQFLKAVTADMGAVVKKVEETGPIIDKELIKRADEFDKMWERGKLQFQAHAAGIINAAISAGSAIKTAFSTANLGDVAGRDVAGDIAAQAAKAAQAARDQQGAKPFIGPREVANVKAAGEAAAGAAAAITTVGTASAAAAGKVGAVGQTSLAAAKAAIALAEALERKTAKAAEEAERKAARLAETLAEKLAKELQETQDSALAAGDAFGQYFAEFENTQVLAMFNSVTSKQTQGLQALTAAAGAYMAEQLRMVENTSALTEGLLASAAAVDSQGVAVEGAAAQMLEADAQSRAWRATMDDLSDSFLEFAQIAGDSMGKVFRQIGAAVSAIGLAQDAVGALKQGFSSLGSGSILKGLSGIVGGIGGIATAASAAFALVSTLIGGLKSLFGGGWEGTVGNPRRDAFIAQYGGDQAMGQKLLDMLMTQGLDEGAAETRRRELMDAGLYAADSEADMNRAMDAIVALIGGQRMHSGGEVTARLQVGERVLSQEQNRWFSSLMDQIPTGEALAAQVAGRPVPVPRDPMGTDRRLEDLVERRLPKLVGRAVADALTLSPRLRT